MDMAVINKQDYINKVENLIEQRDTYRTLTTQPTRKQKNEMINLLKGIKA